MTDKTPDDIFKKVMQDVTTGDGAFDIYTGPWNSTGDLVSSGGATDVTEFVNKYKPDWNDPERGVTTEAFGKQLYTYSNKNYMVGLDGDTLVWYYLKNLYEKPEVKDAFLKEVGRPLAVPNTSAPILSCTSMWMGRNCRPYASKATRILPPATRSG